MNWSTCGVAPPKRGTFFSLRVFERGGISLVEVYERETLLSTPLLRPVYNLTKVVLFQ